MLNARVCRRSKENIILLWDVSNVPSEERKNVKVYLEDGRKLKVHIAGSISEVTNEPLTVSDNTEVCLVNHEENQLEYDKEYDIVVEVGKLSQTIHVYPYGVLPDTEKDEKERHLQLMAWNPKKQRWQKVTGVETPEGFAILVKIIK